MCSKNTDGESGTLVGGQCVGGAYRWVDAALLRASAHLDDIVPDWWPDLEGPAPDGGSAVEPWIEWLAEVWAQRAIADAVRVASPVVADRVDAICGGSRPGSDQVRRLVLAVARYLVRMRGRATPFGLFAGVAPLRFSEGTTVRWAQNHRRVRPDAAWLATMIDRLEACPQVRRRLTMVQCDLATVRGDRLVAPGTSRVGSHDNRTGHTEVSVRHSAAVRLVMRMTVTPVLVSSVIEKVAADFPGGDDPGIEHMIADLIRSGVLITCLRAPSTVVDPLAYVVDRVRELGAADFREAASVLAELEDVDASVRLVDRTNAMSVTSPRSGVCAARRPAEAVVTGVRRDEWAVDLRLGGEFGVPEMVAREAAAAGDALLRLSPAPQGHPGWREYHSRFLDRYGAGAVVALDQLIDPTTGLGLPQHFSAAANEGPRLLSERDERLLQLAQQAAKDNRPEVVLDDAMLDALCPATEPHNEAWTGANSAADSVRFVPHVDLCVEVRATTRAALTAGEFTLAVTGIGRTGVATSGRFLDLLTDHDQRQAVAALRSLPVAVDGAMAAQLSFSPCPVRVDNVARVRPLLPDVLSVGEYRDPADKRLAIGDLAATADHRGMYLISQEQGHVVEPTLVNATAWHTMAPLIRLLAELPRATTATVSLFDWGAARCLPFRPRLRYGRSVLAGARWQLDPDTLPGPHATRDVWRAGLDTARQQLGLPDTVAVGTGDRRLRLNLDEPMDAALLREHLDHATAPVMLAEAATATDHGWLGGRAHEIVVPLATSARPAPAPTAVTEGRPQVVVGRDHGELPGSKVLSARLYCHPDVVDTLLTRHVPELLARWHSIRGDAPHSDPTRRDATCRDTAPRWWFLRFRTPTPHLRLRLHVDDYGAAAQRVGAWAAGLRRHGLTGDLVLDTYRAELARYTYDGAPAAMAAAEAVFATDSVAARAQLLAANRCSTVDSLALTAASMLDLTCALTGGRRAGAGWLVRRADLAAGSRVRDRGLLVQVRELCAVAGTNATLRPWLGVHSAALADAWESRRLKTNRYLEVLSPDGDALRDSIVASLLHLHHVRALGVDPDSEALCHRLARSAALAIIAREPAPETPT